jgi:hypothetical protein
MRARRLLVGHLLDVRRDDDRRDRPLGAGDADRAIDEVRGLARIVALSPRYSLATSLNSARRSTSCWKSPPSDIRFCWPTIATTSALSSLAS